MIKFIFLVQFRKGEKGLVNFGKTNHGGNLFQSIFKTNAVKPNAKKTKKFRQNKYNR